MAQKWQPHRSVASYLNVGSKPVNLLSSLIIKSRKITDEEKRLLSVGDCHAIGHTMSDDDFIIINEDDDDVNERRETSFISADPSETSPLHREHMSSKHPLPLTAIQQRFLHDKASARNKLCQKLEQQGVKATFDFDHADVHIDTRDPEAVDAALDSIKNFVIEMKIDFTEEELQKMAMATDIPDGELVSPFPMLSSDQEILVAVDRVEGSLNIVGMKDAIHGVRETLRRSQELLKRQTTSSVQGDSNLDQGQEQEATITVTVPVRANFQQYIQAFKWDEISALSTEANGLSIDMTDEGIEVTGSTIAVNKAVDGIKVLVGKIRSNTFTFEVGVNMARFTEATVDAGKNHNVVIAYRQCNMSVMNRRITRAQAAPPGNPEERPEAPRVRPKTKVSVVLKRLETQQADVVVNTTNTKLALADGQGVSNSLLTAAGNTIQHQLNAGYPHGITHGDLAVSGPGTLTNCKAIYHAALPYYRGGGGTMELSECYEFLVSVVFTTLIKASGEGYQTIAVPAFGTGALQYPPQNVAQLMFKAIDLFNQDQRVGTVKEIFIVIGPDAELEVKQLFLAHQLTYWLKTRQLSGPRQRESWLRWLSLGFYQDTPSGLSLSAYFQREVGRPRQLKCEVRAKIGDTLMQVIHGDIKKTCDVTDTVMVPWIGDEISNPTDHPTLRCMEPDRHQWSCRQYVADLPQSGCTADSTTIPGKILIHTYTDSATQRCISAALCKGLEATGQNCRMTIPISAEGALAARPADSASAIVTAIAEVYESRVNVVTVVIPAGNIFIDFVSRLAEMRRLEVPADNSMTSLVDTQWSSTFSGQEARSQRRAAAFRTGVDAVMVVTSDSEQRNRTAANEVASELNVNLCDVQRTPRE